MENDAPRNPARYTLGEAAKATGKSKSTLSRAIKSGKISATQREDGGYEIDAAELHRVYEPVRLRNGSEIAEMTRHATGVEPSATLIELATVKARLEAIEAQLEDVKQDRDHWRQQATALLTDQRPKERRSLPPWLSRLFGYSTS